jgi:geranylgeranyl pyrophosphate synthase
MKKQNEIDKLNDDILDIKNNSKLIQKKLNDDILNLKTKLKHIKRELI